MCASCGCGCKMGMPSKGCKCTCKTCRDARTMSVRKSMCGCDCKPKMASKNCRCSCNDCKKSRTMSVEKSMLIRKAMRNFNDLYGYTFGPDFIMQERANQRKAALKGAGKGAALGLGASALGIGIAGYKQSKKNDVTKGLSPKQMKIARQAGNPKKIDAADLAALRNRSRNQG